MEIRNKLGYIKTGRSRNRIDYIRPLDLLILEPFKPLRELREIIIVTISRWSPF